MQMPRMARILCFLSILILLVSRSSSCSESFYQKFIQCLSLNSPETPISDIVYISSNSSYLSILESTIKNLRFSSPTTPKPLIIVTPLIDSHVQAAVICCVQNGLQIRIRSGGHDYEGLSYTAGLLFILLDLQYRHSVSVDVEDKSAWVEAGATLGEVYYHIAEKSPVHGFPAGLCPLVGVGGHLSGGGFGTMLRRYGLAADNIIDARIVNVNGRTLDRESMGEDLFWAIRGGGAASFGVVLSWKIKLVDVPPTVTVFSIAKTLDRNGTKLVNKWQYIGHELVENLFLRLVIKAASTTGTVGNNILQVTFESLFLGTADQLLEIMGESFPELGLKPSDCMEMSWIGSALYFSEYAEGTTIEALRDRTPQDKISFKATSDYVTEPIPEVGLEQLWKWCLEEENSMLIMDPYGGRMDEISESEIPFPHRAGNLYNIQYAVSWDDEGIVGAETHIDWLRRMYQNMSPYVSHNPRAAYINYRDLDLGRNDDNNTSYAQAARWGLKYFKNNFRRLAIVKGEVDPDNFFAFEQSIPPLFSDEGKRDIK